MKAEPDLGKIYTDCPTGVVLNSFTFIENYSMGLFVIVLVLLTFH